MQKGRDLYQIISDTLTKSNIGTSEEIEEITTKIYYDYCEEYYPPFKETPEYKLGKRMLRDVSMQFGLKKEKSKNIKQYDDMDF